MRSAAEWWARHGGRVVVWWSECQRALTESLLHGDLHQWAPSSERVLHIADASGATDAAHIQTRTTGRTRSEGHPERR